MALGKLVASVAVLLALSSGQKLTIGLVAGAFVVFALVSAMVVPRYRTGFPGRGLGWFVAVTILFTIGMMSAIAFAAKEGHEAAEETHVETTKTTSTEPAAPAPPAAEESKGDPVAGKAIFTDPQIGCFGCHTLKAAAATGTVGPNLDQAKPSFGLVVERVTNGKPPMPSFKGTLSPQKIDDVAAFVSSSAGS